SGDMPSLFDARWEDYWPESHQTDSLDRFEKENSRSVSIPLPPAGGRAAFHCVQEFVNKIEEYEIQRDFPAEPGTSRFSLYLKNGSLVSSQIVHALKLENENWKQKTSRSKFLKEIVWREFYYSILWHHPRVETESFHLKYRDLAWENREDWFLAWQEGRTGFPIIDAGMRQLLQEGWMHNRVRMIVASFLTKDLLIDWRWGERHFMQHLLDGDIAPNNGGWQWAASTGCDPQPYFRIFNPLLQSQKFDPEGRYIKKYVPELSALSANEVHAPANPRAHGYPLPLVEHQEQKAKALALFQGLRPH
ncbi:MAG: FAD-binding domain-containing protein, partial [Bdellovibrio sp.]